MSGDLGRYMVCPYCGKHNELASAVGGDGPMRPHDGALSVCIGCGGVAVFEDDFVGLRVRKPRPEEVPSIDADPTIVQTRQAFAKAFGMEPRR